MAKIIYHQDDFTQEVNFEVNHLEQTARIDIIETQDGGRIPSHLLICKKKGENAISINNIRIEGEIYQLLKTIIKDESN